MKPRDIARAGLAGAYRAARATRATWRGNVSAINPDGSAQVKLPNGGVVKIYPTNLFAFSTDQSVTLLRAQGKFEVLAPSAYQGGLGSPFETP